MRKWNGIFIVIFVILIVGCNQNEISKGISQSIEKSSLAKTKIVSESKKDSETDVLRNGKEKETIVTVVSENSRLREFIILSNAIIRVVGFSHSDYSLNSVNADGEIIGYEAILDDSSLNFQGDKKDSFKIIAEDDDESSLLYRAELQCSMWKKNESGSWKSRPLADCLKEMNGLIGKIESEVRKKIIIKHQFAN